MMWEACAEKTKAMGGKIETGCKVTGCCYNDASSTWTVEFTDRQDILHAIEAEANKNIDLKEFVPVSAVDPVTLKAPTILAPMKAVRSPIDS